jgi:hypothetical protein
MRLVLTSEQTKKIASSTGNVEVVDSLGHTIGELTLMDLTNAETKTLSAEELAEVRRQIKDSAAERASNFKTRQVRDRS